MFTAEVRRVADVGSTCTHREIRVQSTAWSGGAADRGNSDQMRGREASLHDMQIEAADRKLRPFLDQIST